jgi:hypothetical protein
MYHAKDSMRIGQITVYAIWIALIFEIIADAVSVFGIFALGGFGQPIASSNRLDLSDTFTQATSALSLLVFIAAAIVTARWIYVTNRNAQSFSDQIAITPGWAVGWFFVPIASLYKPFQGVSATWPATVAPNDIDSVAVPTLLRSWWALWLATCFWGNMVFRASLSAHTPEAIIAAHYLTIAAHYLTIVTLLIDVPLTYALTLIVKRLSAMQSDVLANSAASANQHGPST